MEKNSKTSVLSGPMKKLVLAGAAVAVVATSLVGGYFGVRHYRRVSRVAEAEKLMAAGDYDQAEVLLRYCVLADRDNEKLVVRFAELLEKQKRWRDAAEVWSMAGALNPYNKEYAVNALRALASGREYRSLLAMAGPLPSAVAERDDVLALRSLAEFRAGSQKTAQELFLKLPANEAAKSPLAGLLLFIFGERLDDTPAVRGKLEAFAGSSDIAVAGEAMLILAKIDINAGDFEKAGTVLKRLSELNPEVGMPILGDFYFDEGKFEAASVVYEKAMYYGLTLKSVICYGESLAYSKDIGGIEKLAGYFRSGGKPELMTGCYLDALAAYLKGDDAKVDEFVPKLDESFDSALAVMIQLSSYARHDNVPQVVRLIRLIRGLPRLNYLYPYAYDMVQPLITRLYDQVRINSLASLARVLASPGAPNLLLTRALLLDEMQGGTVAQLDLNNALKNFPDDPTVLDVAAMHAMQRGDFAEMLNLAVRNLDNGNRTSAVIMQQVIALEGLGRIDEANHEFQELLKSFPDDSGIIKNYLAFCVRHSEVSGLDLLADAVKNNKNSGDDRLLPLIAAESSMLRGDTKDAVAGVRRILAENFLDERKPEDAELLFRMAGLLGVANENDDAIKIYQRLKPVYPSPEVIRLNLSELLSAVGDRAQALSEAEAVWKTDDGDTSRRIYGLRLYESGKYEMAERVLGKLVDGETDDRVSAAWSGSAEELIKQAFAAGKYGECRKYCNKLYKRFPENRVALEYADKVAAVSNDGTAAK
ncbi:MAG: hypothetical protein PHI85_06445 [Victivallaceae bacterium]|nr:hypothetical protein [Victivallaceae bacterium]